METLYQRLGGHDGLQVLLKPFYSDVRQHVLKRDPQPFSGV